MIIIFYHRRPSKTLFTEKVSHSRTGVDAAIAVGLPVGLLAIQLEVVVRIHINFISDF